MQNRRMLYNNKLVFVLLLGLSTWDTQALAHSRVIHRKLSENAIDVLNEPFISRVAGVISDGAFDEDDIVLARPCTHAYNPISGDGWCPLPFCLKRFPCVTARSRAVDLWNRAVDAYRAGDRAVGFHLLGRSMHLLQDMTSPAHVHSDVHIDVPVVNIPELEGADDFEGWGTENFEEIHDLEVFQLGNQDVGDAIHEMALFTYERTTYHAILDETSPQSNSTFKSMFDTLTYTDVGLFGDAYWHIDNIGDFENFPHSDDWWPSENDFVDNDSGPGGVRRITGNVYVENSAGDDKRLTPRVWRGRANSNTLMELYGAELYPETVRRCSGLLQKFVETVGCSLAVHVCGVGTTDWKGDNVFPCGALVNICAEETDACWVFDHWEDAKGRELGKEGCLVVELSEDREISAVFRQRSYVLASRVEPQGAGTVEKSPPGLEFTCGTMVDVQAVPSSACWVFTGWGGDARGEDPSTSVTMDSDKNVIATFERRRFLLDICIRTSLSGTASAPAFSPGLKSTERRRIRLLSAVDSLDLPVQIPHGRNTAKVHSEEINGTLVDGNTLCFTPMAGGERFIPAFGFMTLFIDGQYFDTGSSSNGYALYDGENLSRIVEEGSALIYLHGIASNGDVFTGLVSMFFGDTGEVMRLEGVVIENQQERISALEAWKESIVSIIADILARLLALESNESDDPPTAECGNGIHEAGEQCDDGNTISGDDCSAVCQLEANETNSTEPSGFVNFRTSDLSYSRGTSIAVAESCGEELEEYGYETDTRRTRESCEDYRYLGELVMDNLVGELTGGDGNWKLFRDYRDEDEVWLCQNDADGLGATAIRFDEDKADGSVSTSPNPVNVDLENSC